MSLKCATALLPLLLGISYILGQELDSEQLTTILATTNIPVRQPPFKFNKDRTPSGISTRIIGGSVATEHQYPFQVALYVYVNSALYFCGGSLITNEFVMTAAHCVDGATNFAVVLGAHNLNKQEDTTLAFNTSSFIMHERWDSNTLQNDIALIQLPERVTLNNYISTVTRAYGTNTYSGNISRALGWGKTNLGDLSDVLRYVDAEVITNDQCSSYTEYAPYIVSHHLCTSGAGVVGSCNGDSGGSLLVDGIQVGLVSFGVEDCAAGLPSVYTRITEFNDWVDQKIEQYSTSYDVGDTSSDNDDISNSNDNYNGINENSNNGSGALRIRSISHVFLGMIPVFAIIACKSY